MMRNRNARNTKTTKNRKKIYYHYYQIMKEKHESILIHELF